MKSVARLSIVAAALVLAGPVFAQSASKNVTVQANLTSVCRFTAAQTDLTIGPLLYTAFGPEKTGTATANVECTRRTTAPTFTFNSDTGLVAGLQFTLTTLYAETSAGLDPDGTSGSIGSPRTGTVTVTATMAAGQAGTGDGGSVQSATAKTLTVTF